jgi:hypothetical protein
MRQDRPGAVPDAADGLRRRAGEATIDGHLPLAPPTEALDVAVLPQRMTRRPHVLQVLRGDQTRRSIQLEDRPLTLGRGSDCEVRLLAGDLSRRHATIAPTRRGFLLTDLDSRNGVYVNEVRIDSAILRDGDTVQLGNLQLLYHEGS